MCVCEVTVHHAGNMQAVLRNVGLALQRLLKLVQRGIGINHDPRELPQACFFFLMCQVSLYSSASLKLVKRGICFYQNQNQRELPHAFFSFLYHSIDISSCREASASITS